MVTVPKLVPLEQTPIPDDVRATVIAALDANCPFVMIARQPDGRWQTSTQFPFKMLYEVVGALTSLSAHLLKDDHD